MKGLKNEARINLEKAKKLDYGILYDDEVNQLLESIE